MAKELWGYREAARHYSISHTLAKKWAAQGILPLLAEPVMGTVLRKGTIKTPDKWGIMRKEEVERDVECLKVFDADALRAIPIEQIHERLALQWLDEREDAVLTHYENLRRVPKLLYHLNSTRGGFTLAMLEAWVAADGKRAKRWAAVTPPEAVEA